MKKPITFPHLVLHLTLRLTLALGLGIALASTARANTSHACPIGHKDYQKALADFRAFERVVDPSKEHCRDIGQELRALSEFYNQNTRTLIHKTGLFKSDEVLEANLTVEELKTLGGYMENMSGKVIRIMDLMLTRRECFAEEKRPSFLNAIASLVGEVSTIVSAYAGPSAIPIAMGGQLLSGILLGLDKVIRGWKIYDFTKSDHRDLFASNLCAYKTVREQIGYLAKPEVQLEKLRELESRFRDIIKETEAGCKDCARSQLLQASVAAGDPLLATISSTLNDAQMTANEKCSVYADHALAIDSPLEKYLESLETLYAKGAAPADLTKARNTLTALRSGKKIISWDECLSRTDLDVPVKAIGGALRQILTWGLGPVKQEFRALLGGGPNSQLNRWLKAKADLGITLAEIQRAEDHKNSLSAYYVSELLSRRECMDQSLHEISAPDFLDWYVKKAEEAISSFSSNLGKTAQDICVNCYGKGFSYDFLASNDSMEKENLKRLDRALYDLTSQPNNKTHTENYSSLERLVHHLDQAEASLEVVEQFCGYLRNAERVYPAVNKACNPERLIALRQQLVDKYKSVKLRCDGYMEWCRQIDKVEHSAIEKRVNAAQAQLDDLKKLKAGAPKTP